MHACLLLLCLACSSVAQYQPDWTSLDSRPIPQWYNDAKFGIFNHWGLYSVPSVGSEWFWHSWKTGKEAKLEQFMQKNYKPGFRYADFAPMFTAEFFNATRIAQLVADSGAKYYVLTSKHHEGFTMWPSASSWNWNSQDNGPNRNVVGELSSAFKQHASSVNFGLYFSQYEWFNPLYLQDKANNFTTQEYVNQVSYPQMLDIVNTYNPKVIWSDGDWEAPDSYWKSKDFLAWLYNSSPVKDTVVVNDRWGKGTGCHHGGFYNCQDRYSPGVLQKHKWENCMTVDKVSWGYRRTAEIEDILTLEELLTELAKTVSCNGNLLMNVGPTHDGRYIPIFEERLLQMGAWLKVNGEAIYGTRPWIHQNDTVDGSVWYTSKLQNEGSDVRDKPNRSFNRQDKEDTVVYALVTRWPEDGKLKLGAVKTTESTKATMLGYDSPLKFNYDGKQTIVSLDTIPWTKLPSLTAWSIRLDYLATENRDPLFAPIVAK